MMAIDDAIEYYKNKADFIEGGIRYWQLSNWLLQLKEYIEKDTPMEVVEGCLDGCCICPKCGGHTALGVKKYCDVCGQAIVK